LRVAGAQLKGVRFFTRLRAAVAVAAAKVPDDVLVREDRLGDVILHSENRLGL
jgi:hypothetical protein